MNTHDKLKCHQIKELILSKKLPIEFINEADLNILIDYEIDLITESKIVVDNHFLNLCLEALKKYENYEEIISLEDQQKIGEQTYQKLLHQQNNDVSQTAKKNITLGKMLRYLIAAAVLLVALTATVVAVWNPFVSWLKERKLVDIEQGEVLENELGTLTADTQYESFSSVEEMEADLDIHFDILGNIKASPRIITLEQQGNRKNIVAQYNMNQEIICLRIYLENAPYDKKLMDKAQLKKYLLCDIEWYIIENEDITLVAFNDNYVYSITTDTLSSLTNFIEG